jgi:hypothetical protein
MIIASEASSIRLARDARGKIPRKELGFIAWSSILEVVGMRSHPKSRPRSEWAHESPGRRNDAGFPQLVDGQKVVSDEMGIPDPACCPHGR